MPFILHTLIYNIQRKNILPKENIYVHLPQLLKKITFSNHYHLP